MAKQLHGREHRFGKADWTVRPTTLVAIIDNSGAAIAAGTQLDIPVHAYGIITGWRLLADQAGSIQVDVWKTAFSGFPPTVTDSIAGSDLPTLIAENKAESTALTGWTTSIVDGDTIRLNVDSAGTVTRITLSLSIHA
jgi:hypothetical protein